MNIFITFFIFFIYVNSIHAKMGEREDIKCSADNVVGGENGIGGTESIAGTENVGVMENFAVMENVAETGNGVGGAGNGVGGIELFGFMLNGKFDLTLEIEGFGKRLLGGDTSLKNYHRFIFLSRRERIFFFTAEVIDRWFYEFGANFRILSVKFGKILIPFGSDPLIHHSYGGLTGFDQELVPFIWSEHGFNLSLRAENKDTLIINEVYIVNAPKGTPDEVLLLTFTSSPDKLALGDRLTVGYRDFIFYLSLYWNQYSGRYNSILWGVDISFSPRQFISKLSFLSVSYGFLLADIQANPTKLGRYSHFGNYIRLAFALPSNFQLRLMSGRQLINDGTISYNIFPSGLLPLGSNKKALIKSILNFALMYRKKFFFSQLQYLIYLEDKKDKLRFMVGFEF